MKIGLQLRPLMMRGMVTKDGIKGAEIDSLGLKKAMEQFGHEVFRFSTEEPVIEKCDLCINYTTSGKPRPEAKINLLIFQKFFEWNNETNRFFDYSEAEISKLVEISLNQYDFVTTPSNLICSQYENVHYLPLAVDPSLYYPEINFLKQEYACDLMFMGKMETRGPNFEAIYERYILPLLGRYTLNIYGSDSWLNHPLYRKFYKGPVSLEKARLAFSCARLVLSLHSPALIRYDFITARLYQALACGALVVSDDIPSLRRDFGSEVAFANDYLDIRQCVEVLLANYYSKEMKEMRKRSIDLIRREHTWKNRADTILRLVS